MPVLMLFSCLTGRIDNYREVCLYIGTDRRLAFGKGTLSLETNMPARGVIQNPKFRNSEIVRIPIRYSDGHQVTFSDNLGQAQLQSNFFRKLVNLMLIVFFKSTYEVKTQYTKHLNNINAIY